MKATTAFTSFAVANAASLKLTFNDCGAAHGKVTGLTPNELTLGSKTTVTGTGNVDEAVSGGTFEIDLKASVISQTFKGDLCAAKSFSLPLGAGTIAWDGVKCPLSLAKGLVQIPVDITLSSTLPDLLQSVQLTIKGKSTSGDDFLCMQVNTSPSTSIRQPVQSVQPVQP